MIKRLYGLSKWLMDLFDPPPLASMTFPQKVARVLLLSCTLVVGSVVVAMLGAVGLFIMEKGREMSNMPEFFDGMGIIAVGIVVNAVCMAILIQIKRVDTKLVPRGGQAIAESHMEGK